MIYFFLALNRYTKFVESVENFWKLSLRTFNECIEIKRKPTLNIYVWSLINIPCSLMFFVCFLISWPSYNSTIKYHLKMHLMVCVKSCFTHVDKMKILISIISISNDSREEFLRQINSKRGFPIGIFENKTKQNTKQSKTKNTLLMLTLDVCSFLIHYFWRKSSNEKVRVKSCVPLGYLTLPLQMLTSEV